jgi:hypothetical protein
VDRDWSSEAEQGRKTVAPITPRAVLLGAMAVAFLAIVNPYLAFVSRTWSVGSGGLLGSTLVVLFGLVLFNGLLLRLAPRLAFSRGELLVVYGMLIISVGLMMQGGLPYIVASTVYPFHMATPENGWEHMILPHVPLWLRPHRLEVVEWFWQGSPSGFGVPWGDWLTPMLAWGGFTLALMGSMFCLGALLSKDWIEKQRLSFPLVDVPLAITGNQAQPSLRGSILGNRIFWLGFAIPSVLAIVGWFHLLFPAVPSANLYNLEVGRYFAGMALPWRVLWDVRISIIFPIIGITCLLPSEVSLSLWLFYVLYQLQMLVWGSFGIAEEGATSAVAINPRSFVAFQEAGGFIALSAVVLYQSRKAIRAACWSLLGRDRVEADPYAPLAGRWALLGFLLTNGFMIWWAVRAGMSWWSFVVLMGVFYAVLLGASRLVAAGGVMYVDTGFFPRVVTLRTIGAVPIGPTSLTMYAYLSVIYMYDPMNLAMPQMMNSFKLTHSGRLRGSSFTLGAVVALVAVTGVGIVALLGMLHQQGASSLAAWPFTSYPRWAFGELEATLRTPEAPDNWLRLAVGTGAAFTLLLVWLHSRFVWWPVSPVGFLIASSYETNRSMWMNVFIAWAVSTLIRRYGGLRLFRTLRPAFLGLVLGQYLTQGALAIISSVFGITQPLG